MKIKIKCFPKTMPNVQLKAEHWLIEREETFRAPGRAEIHRFWSMQYLHQDVLITESINLPRQNFLEFFKDSLDFFVEAFSLFVFLYMHAIVWRKKKKKVRENELWNFSSCIKIINLIEIPLSYIDHTTCKRSESHTKGFPPHCLRERFGNGVYIATQKGEMETGVKCSLLS